MNVPGLLRERVILKTASRVSNGAGGWTSTWADAATVDGRVVTPSGRRREELAAGGRPADEVVVDLILDGRQGAVTAAQRAVLADGRVFELIRVDRQGDLVMAAGRQV